jgi:cyclopropane-fatty-acyl-phospholipid synthase
MLLDWLTQRVFDRAHRDHNGAPFEIVKWDGERLRFGVGNGPPAFVFTIKKREVILNGLLDSSRGLGEAFIRGDLECEGSLEEGLHTLSKIYYRIDWDDPVRTWVKRVLARGISRQQDDVEHHYGLGNDFYELYLDKKLQYTCGYFRTPEDSLDLAQDQKIAHTAKKLYLKPGQRLLDIGCGWGHLMFHAAEKYGVKCSGITICENQAAYIRAEAKRRNLPVEARVMNYLELDEREKWDRIATVGMMCHVGHEHADTFYDKLEALSADRAVVLTHCISKMRETSGSDGYISKHIFPGYWFFSLEGTAHRSVERGFNVVDVENLRRHYVMTLQHWLRNFNQNYALIQSRLGFDTKFMRKWQFYLAMSTVGFRSGHMNLIQTVMTKGATDDYPWTREFLYQDDAKHIVTGPQSTYLPDTPGYVAPSAGRPVNAGEQRALA